MTPLAPPLIHAPRAPLPVLLSVPHAGRDYPDWLVQSARGGKTALETLEDPLVDRLAWRAIQRGVGAVVARAPRAAVDCNRAERDSDPAIVEGVRHGPLSARARGGLGIIPSRTQQHGYLWRRAVPKAQLEARLDEAHRPYHRAIEAQLELLLDRFGCALLLDCHSMPPPAAGVPPIVYGDRHGQSADRWIGDTACSIAVRHGFAAGMNAPFSGGHVVERHGAPARGVHALQVEIDRRCYLDSTLRAPGEGFDRAAALIAGLAVGLGQAMLDRPYATAAE